MPEVSTHALSKKAHGIDPYSGEVQNFALIHPDNDKRASQEGGPRKPFLWIPDPS